MNKRLIGLLITTIILLGSVTLLQWHGIKFWQEKVGSHGWAWSLLLEFIALWLWYQRTSGFMLLALVASILTLSGPVYQVAKPTFVQSYSVANQHESNKAKLASLESEKARLIEQLSTYQENSTKRTGWLEPITAANNRIMEIDNEIIEVKLSNREKASWFFDWVILMEVASLLLFQVVAVLSITSISKKLSEVDDTNNEIFPEANSKEILSGKEVVNTDVTENEEGKAMEKLVENEGKASGKPLLVAAQSHIEEEKPLEDVFPLECDKESIEPESIEPLVVLEKLNKYMRDKGLNFSEFSSLSGVSSKELSFLRNHTKRLETGKRTVSIPALEKINAVIKAVS